MNWIELKEFIETLSEEQLELPVYVIDSNTDTILELDNAEYAEEHLYATYSEGIYSQINLDELEEEDRKEILEDTYLQVKETEPYLVVI